MTATRARTKDASIDDPSRPRRFELEGSRLFDPCDQNLQVSSGAWRRTQWDIALLRSKPGHNRLVAGATREAESKGNIFVCTEAQSNRLGDTRPFTLRRSRTHHGASDKDRDVEGRTVSVGIDEPSGNRHLPFVDPNDPIHDTDEAPRQPQPSGGRSPGQVGIAGHFAARQPLEGRALVAGIRERVRGSRLAQNQDKVADEGSSEKAYDRRSLHRGCAHQKSLRKC